MADPRKSKNKENNRTGGFKANSKTEVRKFTPPSGSRQYPATAKPAPTGSGTKEHEIRNVRKAVPQKKQQIKNESRIQNVDRDFTNKKINRGASEKESSTMKSRVQKVRSQNEQAAKQGKIYPRGSAIEDAQDYSRTSRQGQDYWRQHMSDHSRAYADMAQRKAQRQESGAKLTREQIAEEFRKQRKKNK